MKASLKNITIKVITVITMILTALFIFQITFADQFSVDNQKIDHILHFTSGTVLILIILLSFIFILLVTKKRWLIILSSIVSGLSLLLLLIALVFSSMIIYSSDRTNYRYYFSRNGEYQYYVVSERFVAFEGSSNFHIYKEKPLFLFIKQRLSVSEEELKNMHLNAPNLYSKFLECQDKL